MKRGWSLLVCCLVLTSAIAGAQGRRSLGKPGNSIGKRILAVGDSITQGAGYTGGYRGILEAKIRGLGYSFEFLGGRTDNSNGMISRNHEGHGGWNTTELLNGRASDPSSGKLGDWLKAYRPDVVLLMAGTNDNPWVSQQEWTLRYLKLLDTIWKYNPDTRVVLASIPKSYTPKTGKQIAEANCFSIVKSIVAAKRAKYFPIAFADTYTNFNIFTDLYDQYHPNKSGYTKIADAFLKALTTGFR